MRGRRKVGPKRSVGSTWTHVLDARGVPLGHDGVHLGPFNGPVAVTNTERLRLALTEAEASGAGVAFGPSSATAWMECRLCWRRSSRLGKAAG